MTNLSSNTENKRMKGKSWLLCMLGIALMLSSLLFSGPSMTLDSEPVQDFGADWMLLNEAGAPAQPGTFLNLPTKVTTEQAVRVMKIIPENIPYPSVLLFRTAHQNVRLFCGEDLLYSFGYDKAPLLGKSPGSVWNIVRLPQNAAGKTLVLELSSPYRGYAGKLDSIQIGSKASLIFLLLRTYAFSFVITLVIFSAALVTLIVDFVVIRKDPTIGKETFYLGLFALFVSLWLFGEGRLTQFFGMPPAANTCSVFLWMLAMPIPLIQYIACGRSPQRQKLLHITTKLLCVMYTVSILLQLFNIVDFIEQIVFIHASLILTCGIVLYTVVADMIRAPSVELYRLVASLSILALCFLMETAGIYAGANNIGNMMRIGVLIFIAMQAQEAFKKASRMMQMSRLAGTDGLTGCLNRLAYNQRLKELADQSNVSVVIADINDLKFINDTYGHETGDDAIVRCAKCFSDVFSAGGNCYRIGGDEFVMLSRNATKEELARMGAAFQAMTCAQQKQVEYPFVVSYGCAVYDAQTDKTIPDTLARADKYMYANKRKFKQHEAKTAASVV